MLPRQHAVTSGLVTLAVAVHLELAAPLVLLWTLVGTISGVVIDVDHALLGMTVGGHWQTGLSWFRHPVAAVSNPYEFLRSLNYPGLIKHRILTHLAVMSLLGGLATRYPIVVPAGIGLATHILGDVVVDLREGRYQQDHVPF